MADPRTAGLLRSIVFMGAALTGTNLACGGVAEGPLTGDAGDEQPAADAGGDHYAMIGFRGPDGGDAYPIIYPHVDGGGDAHDGYPMIGVIDAYPTIDVYEPEGGDAYPTIGPPPPHDA